MNMNHIFYTWKLVRFFILKTCFFYISFDSFSFVRIGCIILERNQDRDNNRQWLSKHKNFRTLDPQINFKAIFSLR